LTACETGRSLTGAGGTERTSGSEGVLPRPVRVRFLRPSALAPFGAPRMTTEPPGMLWRPRRPVGGGLASHPKILTPHAAAATVFGFPMRPSAVEVALSRAGPPKGRAGQRLNRFTVVRLRTSRPGPVSQVATSPLSAGCLPVPGGSGAASSQDVSVLIVDVTRWRLLSTAACPCPCFARDRDRAGSASCFGRR